MSAKPVWGWHPRRSFGSYQKKWQRNQWDETRQKQKNKESREIIVYKRGGGQWLLQFYNRSIWYKDIKIDLSGLVCFTLLRNPFSTLAALTDNDLGILICFSKITANEEENEWMWYTESHWKHFLKHVCLLSHTLEKIIFCVLVRVIRAADYIKGWPPSHHLKHQDAQCPPVHTKTFIENTHTQSSTCIILSLWNGKFSTDINSCLCVNCAYRSLLLSESQVQCNLGFHRKCWLCLLVSVPPA